MRIISNAFHEGGWIPPLHSCAGADVSPSLEWTDAPTGTRSFVLIVDDPDPKGNWLHWLLHWLLYWLLYDIPAKVHTLAQGAREIGIEGVTSFHKTHYGGPCPPPGKAHRYYFRLYALDVPTVGLKPGADRADVERAISGHVLSETASMGRFQSQ